MRLFFLVTLGSLTLAFRLEAQPDPALAWKSLPLIRHLSVVADPLFKQQQDLVELYYEAVARRETPPDMTLFRYVAQPDDTVFTLASRFNLPYETLATLNGWAGPDSVELGSTVLVPSQPGLFLNKNHPGEIDGLMAAWRLSQMPSMELRLPTPHGLVSFIFFPGERFHPVERAYFLGILFRFPLPHAILTSPFGIRSNPFTGKPTFHAGIDLAAPTGTEVYAAREGRVVEVGYNRVLGNHIFLQHDDGYETVYGHLSRIEVSLNEEVSSGTIIGKVGSTGESTGPHLHFEIRRKGHPEDPVPLLPVKVR